jgi:hypothetical protein
MSFRDDLPILRLRIEKYIHIGQSLGRSKNLRHKSAPGKDDWTHSKIMRLAHIHYIDEMRFLNCRFEEMEISSTKVARLRRLLDQIESGMIVLVNGEPVMKEATKRPDAMHSVAFLLTGRPVLKVASIAPEAAKTIKNPFKKG